MRSTKQYTIRARLGKDFDYSEDFRKKNIANEYGNYDKYEKNSIS